MTSPGGFCVGRAGHGQDDGDPRRCQGRAGAWPFGAGGVAHARRGGQRAGGMIRSSGSRDAGWLCGDVIRVVSPSTLESVSPEVREHRCVLLARAVAALTDSEARQAELDRRRSENLENAVRAALAAALEALVEVDGRGRHRRCSARARRRRAGSRAGARSRGARRAVTRA